MKEFGAVFFLVWSNFIIIPLYSYKFPYTISLRAQFEQLFEEKCLKKHPTLVDRFVRKLDDPGNRHIMFVFQEPHLKNGGLGDRFSGLLSAVTMALRFNRTLVIRDSSGLSNFFRPYHPTDIHATEPQFLWDKYLKWSRFNLSLANNDATEYDLYFCINHTGGKTAACSLESGDVAHPSILFRCNRAYLCHYETATHTKAHEDWRSLLGIKPTDDLYEVAGCLLRLVLWPTEALWEAVDKSYYQDLYAPLLSQNITHRPSFHKTSTNDHPKTSRSDSEKEEEEDIDEDRRKRRFLRSRSRRRQLKSKFGIDDGDSALELYPFDYSTFNRSVRLHHLHDFYQIGIHFRCGDHSYLHNFHEYDCRYEPDHPSTNPYMLKGDPYQLATCSREILQNHTQHLIQRHQAIIAENELPEEDTVFRDPEVLRAQFLSFFIASDNTISADQIKEVTKYSHTLISPPGCHVEMSPTWECLSLTLVYWFMMSFSRHLSTQIDYSGAPESSFSRYAGIYGLRNDVFRSGKVCHETINTIELSRKQHNNWFC